MAKFNIHLHFAQSHTIHALGNLNNADYGRAMNVGNLKQNLAWARGNLETALKAIGAFEQELKTGAEVETNYIDHESDEPEAEANFPFSGSF